MTAPFHVGSAGYSACSATASPTPERTQRSGSFRKRRSSGMSELSPQGGSEGYGACDDEVRVERCGKSAPDGWRLSVAVNSIRSNTGMGAGGPTPKAGPAAPGVAGAYRQRCVEIDDCQIQNPAYSLARTRRGPGESQGLFPIDTGTAARCTGRCSGGTAPGSERPDTARLRVEGDDPPHRVHPQLPEGGCIGLHGRHLLTVPKCTSDFPESPPAPCPARRPPALPRPPYRRRCRAFLASGCGLPTRRCRRRRRPRAWR